ncbi:hypothetical protein PQX77_019275 [Marasmius sp. AFHP31]|nr:hypothetical protein PQX77_019275 [Marasmius sp. AFHP31]
MNAPNTPSTPVRPPRTPLVGLSPVKTADNSFNYPTANFRYDQLTLAAIPSSRQPPSRNQNINTPQLSAAYAQSSQPSSSFTTPSPSPSSSLENILSAATSEFLQYTPHSSRAKRKRPPGKPLSSSTPDSSTSSTNGLANPPDDITVSEPPPKRSAVEKTPLGDSPASSLQRPGLSRTSGGTTTSLKPTNVPVGMPWQEFVYEVFRTPTNSEKESWTDDDRRYFRSRAATTSAFFRGKSSHKPADILRLWNKHPYGRVDKDSPLMFSTDMPYQHIGPVQPAMTSFCSQTVQRELVKEARRAIAPSSGLQVHIPTVKCPMREGVPSIDWRYFGMRTHERIAQIHKDTQPLLWNMLTTVATPDRLRAGEEERKYRPIDKVVSTSISKLTFSRSYRANLGPLSEGLFNFASLTPFNKFRYNSHVGNSVAYTTVMRSLDGLSDYLSMTLRDLCRDPARWFIPDNVQNFIRRRSQWLGHVNFMNIGMACTAWARPIASAPDPSVFNFDDKQQRRAACHRDKIDTQQLVDLADGDHEQHVFGFQWLWVLGHRVTRVSQLTVRANEGLRTTGMKQKVPDEPVECFPLPTNNGAETQLPEFPDSILDFLESCGQTSDRHHKRMQPIGGDGLTFELLHKIMQQRQFHASPFHSLQFLQPTLQWWHLFWTNDSRILDRHMGNPAVPDPSSFGYSTAAIDQKLSKEQGKYSYNKASELLYLVLDARMLDCWRLLLTRVAHERDVALIGNEDAATIIEALHHASKLPSLAEFESYAYKLHTLYTTEAAIYRAASGRENRDMPTAAMDTPSGQGESSSGSQLLDEIDAQLAGKAGDEMLAWAKDYMREAMRSRECIWAAAEGDVGRVWQQILNLLFCFASSSHKKYAQYLLEVIIDLEYESSPELHQAVLSTAVATLSGMPGTHRCCDLLQEFFQRILEEIVQHKGAEFGQHFIRHIIARNLAHFQHLKEDFLGGVGLEKRSQRRSKPRYEAELRILQDLYRRSDVHRFIKYRIKKAQPGFFKSAFRIGVNLLRAGLLKRWTTRQMLFRDRAPDFPSPNDEDDVSDNDTVTVADVPLVVHEVQDGEISVKVLDASAAAQMVINHLEAIHDAEATELDDERDSSDEEMDVDDGKETLPFMDGFSTDDDELWGIDITE